ncbi:hypothetical protein BVZ31_14665 [Alcaligenes faecalis]|nr:hypothetical protein BVZ30_17240 [Alcaligenes faecalis]OSZ48715.1 hypothetical protein BVZ31_14665 [Alcaligenes faecalis]OSZ54192.1 hypothetical protein BVZ32_05545 [Alcaligenes faecalis]
MGGVSNIGRWVVKDRWVNNRICDYVGQAQMRFLMRLLIEMMVFWQDSAAAWGESVMGEPPQKGFASSKSVETRILADFVCV